MNPFLKAYCLGINFIMEWGNLIKGLYMLKNQKSILDLKNGPQPLCIMDKKKYI